MLTANNALVNWKSLKSAPAGRPAGVKLLRTVRQIGGGKAATPFLLRRLQLQTTTRHFTTFAFGGCGGSDRLAAVRSVMIVRGLRMTSMYSPLSPVGRMKTAACRRDLSHFNWPKSGASKWRFGLIFILVHACRAKPAWGARKAGGQLSKQELWGGLSLPIQCQVKRAVQPAWPHRPLWGWGKYQRIRLRNSARVDGLS